MSRKIVEVFELKEGTLTPDQEAALNASFKNLLEKIQRVRDNDYWQMLRDVTAAASEFHAQAEKLGVKVQYDYGTYGLNGDFSPDSDYSGEETVGARIAGSWLPSSMSC